VGLDSVELILRAEELFSIAVSDEEAARVRTVGDFYVLICTKLDIRPLESPVTPLGLPIVTEREKVFLFLSRHKPLPAPPEVLPWSPQSVWECLIAVFADQLSLKPEKIKYQSEIARDLGVD
jgi:hypothetical protein